MPATSDDDPLDRTPAAVARLSETAVDVELVLHRAPVPVRRDVVAKRRPLPFDPLPQHGPQRAVETRQLGPVELARGAKRMNLRAPERLVRVDVPDTRQAPLVEEEGLDGCRATCRERGEAGGGEGWCERLGAEASVEVHLQVLLVEELPRPEPPDVPVTDRPAAVERERRPTVRVLRKVAPGCVPERPGHAQVDDERPPAGEPPEQVLAPAVERHDPFPDESVRDEHRVDGPGEAGVDDLGGRDRRPLEHGREAAPDRLDLGQLGHPAIVRTARPQ